MEKKTFYITKTKLGDLKKEYEELMEQEKQKTVGQEAPKLFASEDMNPDFVSFQEDMDSLRARIDELRNILDNYELIKAPSKEQKDVVNMGALVSLDMNGKKDEFTIVGTLEANPAEGKISNESPVGKAVLGKKVGEEVAIPAIKKAYKIKSIKYEIS